MTATTLADPAAGLAHPGEETNKRPERGTTIGADMATTSSTSEPPPIDPLPLIVLLLPAAWFARYGLRGPRAWRVAR